MSGGEPSSIKQKPSCAADLPILSPKCGKAAGCVYSNYLCAVLWGAERISIETTLSIEFATANRAFRAQFSVVLYKNPRACRGFLRTEARFCSILTANILWMFGNLRTEIAFERFTLIAHILKGSLKND